MRIDIAGIGAIAVALIGSGVVTAQDLETHPELIEAAVAFVVNADNLGPGGSEVLLDVEALALAAPQAGRSPELKAVVDDLRSTYGFRRGSVGRAMICPPDPPPPDRVLRGYQGCRFTGATRAIVQVGLPRETDGSVLVWIGTWQPVADPDRSSHYIAASHRELVLAPSNGEWTVVSIKRQARSRW